MTINCFMKMDSVEGEAVQKNYEKQIEVQKWEHSLTNESNLIGGGSGVGKVQSGVFRFTHEYDKASPVLAKNCASGKHIDSAKLSVCKAGDGAQEYLTITLKHVMVTTVFHSASTGGHMLEDVCLSFEDYEVDHKTQGSDGKLGASTKFGCNFKTLEIR